MAVVALLVAGVLVVFVAALAWRLTSQRRRSRVDDGVTEEQARQNAAPLTTAILSGSRARHATRNTER
jgi:Flp pilus assembly protein TadB